MVIKSSFDPNIKWQIPEGDVPFKRNEAEEGTEHTLLQKEARKLYNFLEGGNAELPRFRKEQMFIQMLEGLHSSEAELLIAAKDKKLHQVFKGLSDNVVKEAFGWTDHYTRS
jgi:DNA-binding PadR family transcriptional regulator